MEVADVDPVRVLFVTGDQQTGRSAATNLEGERSNLSTVTERTVPEALDRLEQAVDAVVSGYRLAGDRDGIDLLEAVREVRPHLPFFIVSAAGDESVAAEATAHDVTDGTRIGLAVVQEIVEAHDWTVRATDSDAGGARFEIRGVDTA